MGMVVIFLVAFSFTTVKYFEPISNGGSLAHLSRVKLDKVS
jgi:hypothetical protein